MNPQTGLEDHKDKDKNLLFNEAVNFDLETIFIAIPKTGTTSIRSQLASPDPKLISSPHLTLMQVRDGLYTYFLKQALGRNGHFPTRDADVASDAEIRAKASDTFRSFFKFGNVRNPWARVVSLYARREGVTVNDDVSFESFCDQLRYASDTCIYPTRLRNQRDWLVDEDDRIAVNFVLKLEEMEIGLAQIRELTDGRLQLGKRELNRNPGSKSTKYRDMYNSHSRQCIATLFEKDIDEFGYTF